VWQFYCHNISWLIENQASKAFKKRSEAFSDMKLKAIRGFSRLLKGL